MGAEMSRRISRRSQGERGFRRKLLLGLLALALLTPLGIVLPRAFHAEEPFGEWGPERLQGVLGYVPERLMRAPTWHAPFAGYSLPNDGTCLTSRMFSYAIAGMAGLALVGLAVVLLVRIVRLHER